MSVPPLGSAMCARVIATMSSLPLEIAWRVSVRSCVGTGGRLQSKAAASFAIDMSATLPKGRTSLCAMGRERPHQHVALVVDCALDREGALVVDQRGIGALMRLIFAERGNGGARVDHGSGVMVALRAE